MNNKDIKFIYDHDLDWHVNKIKKEMENGLLVLSQYSEAMDHFGNFWKYITIMGR